ncbi:hydrolase [Facklamia sp. 7083-14-GEN3]|uniref:hydrolase n=1 Tax=Facklamia sp. 7083-14-GEN3 TaxID=2973478 RepID=UPI00215BCCC9|nr:hydrolase [Facklamia sp. 7083-14-GEN3]MCR8969967.1 hydrolase [Facklamia sp. 7083-14-GEN3]
MAENKFNKEAFLEHYKGRDYSYESIQTEMDDDNNSHVVIKELEGQSRKRVPEFTSKLRHRLVEVPDEIYQASGIRIFGHRIKSLLFSTDVALIRNSNAHAVMSVYPFTPQMAINQSLINASSVPVFTGVGGGTTSGERSIQLAFQSEQAGAFGVVVNSPMENDVIRQIAQVVDVPVVATISSEHDDFIGKLNAGADMLNVSGGATTARLVSHIRQQVGDVVPIIATGGPTGPSILETIEAGANAITYTPPASADIFAELMAKYRRNK